MNKLFYPFVLFSFLVSCNSPIVPKQEQVEIKEKMTPIDWAEEGAYFIATGHDWNLSISEMGIQFQSKLGGFERFSTPHVTPDLAQDADVKRYRAETESGVIEIQLYGGGCENEDSDFSDYRVEASIQRGIDSTATVFQGCGKYLKDQ